jgi:hypothetical protein
LAWPDPGRQLKAAVDKELFNAQASKIALFKGFLEVGRNFSFDLALFSPLDIGNTFAPFLTTPRRAEKGRGGRLVQPRGEVWQHLMRLEYPSGE